MAGSWHPHSDGGRKAKMHVMGMIPGKYLHKEVSRGGAAGDKFVEFDFRFYNRTRFAGLENSLPNCYCNALLQVLYFTKPLCSALLGRTPNPAIEFSTQDELTFLMHMLQQSSGEVPCQAQNLMRCLMQVRGTQEEGGRRRRPAMRGLRCAAELTHSVRCVNSLPFVLSLSFPFLPFPLLSSPLLPFLLSCIPVRGRAEYGSPLFDNKGVNRKE